MKGAIGYSFILHHLADRYGDQSETFFSDFIIWEIAPPCLDLLCDWAHGSRKENSKLASPAIQGKDLYGTHCILPVKMISREETGGGGFLLRTNSWPSSWDENLAMECNVTSTVSNRLDELNFK